MVHTRNGNLVCSPAGARIVAMAFSEDEQNLFFTHPDLADMVSKGTPSAQLAGGPGGDRVRFAPEYAFAWEDKPRDLIQFSTYAVQEQEDPGDYEMTRKADAITFTANPVMTDKRDGRQISFSIVRKVSLLRAPPIDIPAALRFMGYAIHQTITSIDFQEGQEVGLWNLIQVPAGHTLIVPTIGKQAPMPYFNTGAWTSHDDHLIWPYGGKSNAKIGFSADQIPGRTAAVSPVIHGRQSLIIRDFNIETEMRYCDGPTPESAGSQVFQAWDGFGFGEMEYHAPAVGLAPLPGTYTDTSLVWAFDGDEQQVEWLRIQLLGIQ